MEWLKISNLITFKCQWMQPFITEGISESFFSSALVSFPTQMHPIIHSGTYHTYIKRMHFSTIPPNVDDDDDDDDGDEGRWWWCAQQGHISLHGVDASLHMQSAIHQSPPLPLQLSARNARWIIASDDRWFKRKENMTMEGRPKVRAGSRQEACWKKRQ